MQSLGLNAERNCFLINLGWDQELEQLRGKSNNYFNVIPKDITNIVKEYATLERLLKFSKSDLKNVLIEKPRSLNGRVVLWAMAGVLMLAISFIFFRELESTGFAVGLIGSASCFKVAYFERKGLIANEHRNKVEILLLDEALKDFKKLHKMILASTVPLLNEGVTVAEFDRNFEKKGSPVSREHYAAMHTALREMKGLFDSFIEKYSDNVDVSGKLAYYVGTDLNFTLGMISITMDALEDTFDPSLLDRAVSDLQSHDQSSSEFLLGQYIDCLKKKK